MNLCINLYILRRENQDFDSFKNKEYIYIYISLLIYHN